MAFPTGWLRRCKLTVQHGQVTADQANFPVLVTEASLPSEMLTLGGGNAAQSDGGDIRFSSDSAGLTQLPCEVSLWTQDANPALAKAEFWVKLANIYTATDVDIYVWYSAGGGLTQPVASDTYGSQNVWDSNFKLVDHFADGSSLNSNDSTSNGNNGTPTSVSAGAGKIDGAASFNGTTSKISVGTPPSLNITSVMTISAWINPTSFGGGNTGRIFDKNTAGVAGYIFFVTSTNSTLQFNSNATGVNANNNAISTGSWQHVVAVYDGSNVRFYVNGSAAGAPAFSTNPSNNSSLAGIIGGRGADNLRGFAGSIDELRISNAVRSATWISTEYNNQNAPGSFLVAGTPSGTGGASIIPQVMHHFRMLQN